MAYIQITRGKTRKHKIEETRFKEKHAISFHLRKHPSGKLVMYLDI